MIWDNISIFRTNCTIAWGTCTYMLRGSFAQVVCRKWHLKFPKFFMLLANNSTFVCWNFCLSIIVVTCSNVSEVRYRLRRCSTGSPHNLRGGGRLHDKPKELLPRRLSKMVLNLKHRLESAHAALCT